MFAVKPVKWVQVVVSLVVFKDRLYAEIDYPTSIDEWDGSKWRNSGTVGGRVECFGIVGDTLYVGGGFASIDGVSVQNLAAWDGIHWSSPGSAEGAVQVLAEHKGSLYVGGKFLRAGSVEARRIARFDGTSWSSLGLGWRGLVRAFAFQQNTLIAVCPACARTQ